MVEVLFELYSYALCGERGLYEVAVVGFVIGLERDGSGGGKQVLYVKVADKVVVGVDAFPVSEVSVEEQAVVEEAAA